MSIHVDDHASCVGIDGLDRNRDNRCRVRVRFRCCRYDTAFARPAERFAFPADKQKSASNTTSSILQGSMGHRGNAYLSLGAQFCGFVHSIHMRHMASLFGRMSICWCGLTVTVDWPQFCIGRRCAAALPVWHCGRRLNRSRSRGAVILSIQILREMPVFVFRPVVRVDLLVASRANVSLFHDFCER